MTGARGIISNVARRQHVGIEVRHREGCPRLERDLARCRCEPAYRASVWIADRREPGKGRRAKRTFSDLDDAVVWRGQAAAQAKRDAGILLRSEGDVPTIREAGDALIAGMESGAVRKRNGSPYRAGVVRVYRRALASHVYPHMGGRRLDGLNQPDLLELVERLQEARLAPSSIRNAIDPLRTLYRRAVARGVVGVNPTLGLELPTGATPRDRVADPVEAGRLVAAQTRLDDRALWAVALFCGLRAGELRALLWLHVDLARSAITVRESLPVDARDEDETSDPKTAAGVRTVPIPPVAHDALTALRASLAAADGDRVFPAQDGGPFARTSVMRRARTAWKAAKLAEIGLHEARHSCVSMWIRSGLDVRMVSELAGHVSPAFTLHRYAHVFETDVDHAARTFAAYLERADTDARLRQIDDSLGQ
jgi:integrase